MVKPRNVAKFTASSTETSGARPAAGRKPANASSTERSRGRKKEREEEEEEEETERKREGL